MFGISFKDFLLKILFQSVDFNRADSEWHLPLLRPALEPGGLDPQAPVEGREGPPRAGVLHLVEGVPRPELRGVHAAA